MFGRIVDITEYIRIVGADNVVYVIFIIIYYCPNMGAFIGLFFACQ